MHLLAQAIVLLLAAVIAVLLFKRFGLGSVLGYLVAGMAIGPSGLALVTGGELLLHFSEIGVILLLFLIGLELNPSRLWVMRRAVFGLGGLQVAVTAALLGGLAAMFGLAPNAAIVAGFGLALSSTAFVLPILAEKRELQTRHGQSAFAILLFQDLAVIPMLALMPVLAGREVAGGSRWLDAGKAGLAIVAVVLAGRFLVRPLLRAVASVDSHEIFTATALLVVLGTAALMQRVGLSMSLGAFLAGVLLSESEYRHELQADIEPFKGLLLGLFFVTVGMGANLRLFFTLPLRIGALVLGFMAIKTAVLFALGRASRHPSEGASVLAAALPQGGEFAFVLFGIAASVGIATQEMAELLVVVVTASMIVSPLFFALNERWVRPNLSRAEPRAFDTIDDAPKPVIIAGFGRFGQIVARVLRTRRIGFTALEVSPAQVDFVRRFGNKLYYGDASRLDLLRAAHADQAKAFVLAIDDPIASVRTAETVKTHFPTLRIFARARNRQHAYQLMALGVTLVTRETLHSSLDLSRQLLSGLGLDDAEAARTVEKFAEHDERLLQAQFLVRHDEKALIQTSQQAAAELESLFAADAR